MSALTFDRRAAVALPRPTPAGLAARAAGLLRGRWPQRRRLATLHQLSPALLRDIGMEHPAIPQDSRALALELAR